MIGRTISHYCILEKIGQGGMGEVHLAEDTSVERKVALKFLPSRLQDDEIAHRRFVREAKSAAGLDHPYICKIYETGESDGRDFMRISAQSDHLFRWKATTCFGGKLDDFVMGYGFSDQSSPPVLAPCYVGGKTESTTINQGIAEAPTVTT